MPDWAQPLSIFAPLNTDFAKFLLERTAYLKNWPSFRSQARSRRGADEIYDDGGGGGDGDDDVLRRSYDVCGVTFCGASCVCSFLQLFDRIPRPLSQPDSSVADTGDKQRLRMFLFRLNGLL